MKTKHESLQVFRVLYSNSDNNRVLVTQRTFKTFASAKRYLKEYLNSQMYDNDNIYYITLDTDFEYITLGTYTK